jgi:uncharacterized protein
VILLDTGVMIAMLDRQDPDHQRCVLVLQNLPNEPLLTTWCCLTEAMYFLGKLGGINAQNKLWNLILAQRIGLHTANPEEVGQMHKLMNKYHDLPMDIADASLVVVAQNLGLRKILTLVQKSANRYYLPSEASTIKVL